MHSYHACIYIYIYMSGIIVSRIKLNPFNSCSSKGICRSLSLKVFQAIKMNFKIMMKAMNNIHHSKVKTYLHLDPVMNCNSYYPLRLIHHSSS